MRTKMKYVCWGGAILVIAGGLAACLLEVPSSLNEMKQTVRKKFPDVPQMKTSELAAWLKDKKKTQPVLLDTRTQEEYAVSHLPGAIRVDPDASADEIKKTLPVGKPVVTYCSVGYRSSAVAERLVKAGLRNVSDLEGSIFEWANEGRPLISNGKPVSKVHPYNSYFGKMLDPKLRADL